MAGPGHGGCLQAQGLGPGVQGGSRAVWEGNWSDFSFFASEGNGF